jgi:hypothetical protein
MPKKAGSSRAGDPSSDYEHWDQEAAAARALEHANRSEAVDRASGAVWNFAFGSNINPAKVAERQMTAMYAVRGRLPGWRLLFNHRGGYGNIEATAVIAERGLDVSHLTPPEPEPEPEPVTEARPKCATPGCGFLRHSSLGHGYCCNACMRGGAHGRACEREEAAAVLPSLVQDEVHGALLLLTKEEFGRLASEEYGYDTIEVAVHVYEEDVAASYTQQGGAGGKKSKQARIRPKIATVVRALAFKTSACAAVEATTLPSTRYIQLLREGAASIGIDKGYREWLGRVPSSASVF